MATPIPEIVPGKVYPVHNNKFAIKVFADPQNKDGLGEFKSISCMESFSIAFDKNIEEYKPLESKGWTRRLATGNSVTITLNGKRDYGDGSSGNDYAAKLAYLDGDACSTEFLWILPNGEEVQFPCVLNVTSMGGDSTNIDALEIEVMSDGFVEFPKKKE